MKRNAFVLLFIILAIAPMAVYHLFFQNLVTAYFDSEAPAWFGSVIETIYPRLAVEKHRYSPLFFLDKAQLVIYRWGAFSGFIAIVCWLAGKEKWKSRWVNFWGGELDFDRTLWLQRIYFIALIIITHDWYSELASMAEPAAYFYKPISFFKIIASEYPNEWVILTVWCVMLMSAVICLIKRQRHFSLIAVALFIYLQGLYFGFEKIDHGYTTFTYAGALLVLANYISDRNKVPAWPYKLIQVVIALCYLLAGLEKLTISGIDWASAETFRAYLVIHAAPVGLWVAKFSWMCTLLSVGALLFQLFFWLVFVNKRFRNVALASGVLFHWGTVVLFGISSLFNPWIIVYIFFFTKQK